MFSEFKRLILTVRYLFSWKAATKGRYDERDLLLGHGLDNLVAIRLLVVIVLFMLCGLWLHFIYAPDFYSALSFALVFVTLCWYIRNLPDCGLADSLQRQIGARVQAYRSYFGGRILFTPQGLSLCWHRRILVKTATTELGKSSVSTQQSSHTLNSNAPVNTNLDSIVNSPSNTSVDSFANAKTNPSVTSRANCNEQSPLVSVQLPSSNKSETLWEQWERASSDAERDTVLFNAQFNSTSRPSSSFTDKAKATVSDKEVKLDKLTVASQTTANHQSKNANISNNIHNLSESHDEYSAESAANDRLDSALSTDNDNLGSAFFIIVWWRKFWKLWSAPPTQVRVQDDTYAATHEVGKIETGNSGYLTYPKVRSLYGYRLHAAMGLRLDQLKDLTYAMLPDLSQEAHTQLTYQDVFFMGFGFRWLPKHTRKLHQLMEVGVRPAAFGHKGTPDIHSVEEQDAFKPLYFASEMLQGHTMLFGTTGSGKTRFFDLLVTQAILRHETVIIIDPKGDRSLQQCIIRAMRMAGREVFSDLFCLDIGRSRGLELNLEAAERYAALSMGRRFPKVGDSLGQSLQHKIDLGSVPFIQRAQKSMQSKNKQQDTRMPNIMQQNTQHQECGEPICTQPNLMPQESLQFKQTSQIQEPVQSLSTLMQDERLSPEQDPDAYFFEYMNSGFNPTSSFDRSTEIGERICAMMPDSGSAASFKAYAQMAVSAAVECLMITGQPVVLENIRSIVSDHSAFIKVIRFFLNRTVLQLDETAVSIFFGRIHGIKLAQLQSFSPAVVLLLGDYADQSASRRQERVLLEQLVERNIVDVTGSDDKLRGYELNEMPTDPADDNADEESGTTKTTRKRTSSVRTKKNDNVHPASLTDLNKFYEWLIKFGYIQKHRGLDKIMGIATLVPDFYRRVTNGVMPYLSALTAGALGDLLSGKEQHLPTFLELIENNKVFYVALHCLKDASTGQALGRLMMSDLAFVAGELNLQNKKHPRVSIFIDEASELSNEGLLQLLNKSRSVNFSITLATQCMADLTKRTGSAASASQIIANCNNLISLRVNDPESASVVSSVLPHTVVGERSSSVMVSENGGLNSDSYTTSRSLMQKEAPLFPNSMLMQLPDLEFIARMASGGFYKGFLPILQPALEPQSEFVDKSLIASSELYSNPPFNSQVDLKNKNAKASNIERSELPQQSERTWQSQLSEPLGQSEQSQQTQQSCNSQQAVHAQQAEQPSYDYEPELAQLAKMVDLGFKVQPQSSYPWQKAYSQYLFGSCWDARSSMKVETLRVSSAQHEPYCIAGSKAAKGIASSKPPLQQLSCQFHNQANVQSNTFSKQESEHTAHTQPSFQSNASSQQESNQQTHTQSYFQSNTTSQSSKDSQSKDNTEHKTATLSNGKNQNDVQQGRLQHLYIALTKYGHMLFIFLIKVLFSVRMMWLGTVVGLAAIKLSAGLVLSCLFFGLYQVKVFWLSWYEVICNLGFFVGSVLPKIITQQYFFFASEHLDLGARAQAVWSLYGEHLELMAALLVTGLLWGQHCSLVSEVHHRSTMGLRQFAHILGWPWLLLWIFSAVLLLTGFILSVEWCRMVLGMAALSIGFYAACFYSLHTR